MQSWCVQCVQYVYDPNARILNFKAVGGGTTKRNEMEEEPLLPLPRHLREANDDGDRRGGDDRIHEDVDADDGGAGEGAGEGEGAGLWEERGRAGTGYSFREERGQDTHFAFGLRPTLRGRSCRAVMRSSSATKRSEPRGLPMRDWRLKILSSFSIDTVCPR